VKLSKRVLLGRVSLGWVSLPGSVLGGVPAVRRLAEPVSVPGVRVTSVTVYPGALVVTGVLGVRC
jgi:hypothetical protein